MIFAVLDYIEYRLQLGRHDPAAIEAQKGRLASRRSLLEAPGFKPADIFIMHTRVSAVSWLIMYFTESAWSHTGLFVDSEWIVHSTASGVIKERFQNLIDGRSFIAVFRPPLADDATRVHVAEETMAHLGEPYGYWAAVRMGWNIMVARRGKVNLRLTIDICVILGLASLVARPMPLLSMVISTAAMFYLAIVSRNTRASTRRRAVSGSSRVI